jgi:hypothetical protein
MHRATHLLLSLTVAAAIVPGCRSFDEEPEKPKVDRRKVNLPEAPPLEVPKEVQLHTEDGAWTVAGLLLKAPELLGKDVQVRGIVVDKVECPTPDEDEEPDSGDATVGEADAGEPTPAPDLTCHPPPHLFLTDDLAEPTRQVLVTGTNPQIRAVSVAQPVTLTGRFTQWSDDKVFVRTEGLLQLSTEAAPPAVEQPEQPPAQPAGADATPSE